jgi:hypothetical protein
MSSRPYIAELLVPADVSGCTERCRRGKLVDAIVDRFSWMAEDERIVDRLEIGRCDEIAGFIWVRAVIHFSIPPADVCTGADAEIFTYMADAGEVFKAEDDTFFVTKDKAHFVDGSLARRAFRGKDRLDIEDARLYLLQLVRSDLSRRVLALLHTQTLPGDAAEFINQYKADEGLPALLRLDAVDIQDAAETIVKKLRTSLCTDDLYQPTSADAE